MATTADGTTGVGAHYWTVTLTPPKQAPAALQEFVAMAQEAIQTSVDLLGRGVPELPPLVDDLLTTTTYQDLGAGAANANYQALLAEVDKRKESLLESDNTVTSAAITVSARSDSTLKYVEGLVEQLQSEMTALTGKLTSAQCAAVMQQIGYVMDVINARVTAVYEANNGTAGTGSGGSGTGSGSGSSSSSTGDSGTGSTASGSGDGSGAASSSSSTGSSGASGLSSLIEMLPMVGLMAIPLVTQMAPQVLKALGLDGQHQQNGASGPAGVASQANPAQQNTATPQPAATPSTTATPQIPATPPAVSPSQTGTTPANPPPQASKTTQSGPQQVENPPTPSSTQDPPAATTPAAAH